MNDELNAINSTIFVLESKLWKTKEFFARKEIKEKLALANTEKENIFVNNRIKEETDERVRVETEKRNAEFQSRDSEILNKIRTYI